MHAGYMSISSFVRRRVFSRRPASTRLISGVSQVCTDGRMTSGWLSRAALGDALGAKPPGLLSGARSRLV